MNEEVGRDTGNFGAGAEHRTHGGQDRSQRLRRGGPVWPREIEGRRHGRQPFRGGAGGRITALTSEYLFWQAGA
jgi:hypothetical protein